MTEKRFYIKCDEFNAWSVWEADKDMVVFDLLKSDAQLVCDKLNEQHEEKEELIDALNQRTEQCDKLHEENQALKSDRARYEEECRLDVFKELSEENEQLKETIKTQNFNYKNAKGIIHSSEHQIQRLQDENEQLKQFKEDVFNKIDMYLRMLPTARDNEFNEDDGDPSLYVGAIYMLETLKKELEE